jgi:hypothetical protein
MSVHRGTRDAGCIAYSRLNIQWGTRWAEISVSALSPFDGTAAACYTSPNARPLPGLVKPYGKALPSSMQKHLHENSQAFSRLLAFWTAEHSLSVMLALLVLDFFVLTPGRFLGRAVQSISVLFLILALLAGVLSLERKSFRRAGALLVAGTVAFRTAGGFSDASWLRFGDMLFTFFSLSSLILIVYRQVSKEGPVSGHVVRGAIALYLLIAMLFAFLYGLADELSPGAFSISGVLADGAGVRGEAFYYFSIVTLTTVGFGDITAVHPFVRSLVMLEALIGQLYPAILIARLVTLQLETQRSGNGRP